MSKKNLVLYPGTFDPFTNGHLALVERAAELFDKVIVAVGNSSKKSELFSLEQRVAMIDRVLENLDNVEVTGFEGLTTDLAKEYQTNIILRGLRTGIDFEYEFQLNWMNQHLAPDLETIFMAPTEKYSGVSSTLVKEIAKFGGDYEQFVPPAISQALEDAFAAK